MAYDENFLRRTYGAGLADRQALQAGEQRQAFNALRMDAAKQQMIREQTLNQRTDKQYSDDQRLQNTYWLAQAAGYAQENPQALPGLIDEGVKRGVLSPDIDPSAVTPDLLEKVKQDAMVRIAGMNQRDQRVSKTWINPETGTMWGMSSTGSAFDTGVPAQQFAYRPIETGAGTAPFDPSRGTARGVIAGTDAEAMRERSAADKQAEALASGRGQAQAAEEVAQAKAEQVAPEAAYRTENVISVIDRAIGNANAWTTGLPGSLTKGVPGTPAFDLAEDLKTIKAATAFDRLKRMREESKTGGALGQVAVAELQLLEASVRSLEQAQSKAQFVDNLQAVREQYARAMQAYNAMKAQNTPEGVDPQLWQFMTPEERALWQNSP